MGLWWTGTLHLIDLLIKNPSPMHIKEDISSPWASLFNAIYCMNIVTLSLIPMGMLPVRLIHNLEISPLPWSLERPDSQTSTWLSHSLSYGPSGLVTDVQNTYLAIRLCYDPLNQLLKEGEKDYYLILSVILQVLKLMISTRSLQLTSAVYIMMQMAILSTHLIHEVDLTLRCLRTLITITSAQRKSNIFDTFPVAFQTSWNFKNGIWVKNQTILSLRSK